MKIQVIIPSDFMGEVTGNLNSKRGRIEAMNDRPGLKVIDAKVPLSEMFGYATELRSMSQGRGIVSRWNSTTMSRRRRMWRNSSLKERNVNKKSHNGFFIVMLIPKHLCPWREDFCFLTELTLSGVV